MTQPWYVTAYDEHYFQTYKDEFTPEQTAVETDGALRLLNLAPGARVLDVCCGFGRHSVELAKQGYQVTGLDLSGDLLRHARDASDAAGVSVEWIQADMRDIPAPKAPYDGVICLFSSFGVFGDDGEELTVAKAMARVLAPGGRLLIETVNREVMLRYWQALRWREQPDGVIVCDKLRFDVTTGMLHANETAIHPDGTRVPAVHELRLWAYTELKMLLGMAGIGEVVPFGNLDGTTYTKEAHRLVVVGTKT